MWRAAFSGTCVASTRLREAFDHDGGVGGLARSRQVAKRFEAPGITAAKLQSADYADFVARQINESAPAIRVADLTP